MKARLAQLQNDLYVIYSGSSGLPCRSGEALQSPRDIIQMCMSQGGSRQTHGKIQALRKPGFRFQSRAEMANACNSRLNVKSPQEQYWSTSAPRVQNAAFLRIRPTRTRMNIHANEPTLARWPHVEDTGKHSCRRICARRRLKSAHSKFVAGLPYKKVDTQPDSLQVRLLQLKPRH